MLIRTIHEVASDLANKLCTPVGGILEKNGSETGGLSNATASGVGSGSERAIATATSLAISPSASAFVGEGAHWGISGGVMGMAWVGLLFLEWG